MPQLPVSLIYKTNELAKVQHKIDIIFNAYRLESANEQNAHPPKSVILSGASAESKNLRNLWNVCS